MIDKGLTWILSGLIIIGLIIGVNFVRHKYSALTKVADNTANVQRFLKLGEVPTSDPDKASEAFTTMALNAKDGELCLSVIKKTITVADNTGDCICNVTKTYHDEIQEKCK